MCKLMVIDNLIKSLASVCVQVLAKLICESVGIQIITKKQFSYTFFQLLATIWGPSGQYLYMKLYKLLDICL